jgi:hypothetical protein
MGFARELVYAVATVLGCATCIDGDAAPPSPREPSSLEERLIPPPETQVAALDNKAEQRLLRPASAGEQPLRRLAAVPRAACSAGRVHARPHRATAAVAEWAPRTLQTEMRCTDGALGRAAPAPT